MAATVVMSTLMVLLSESGYDFEALWQTNMAVNDPQNDKHSMEIADVISGGTFRSAKIDSWATENFDTIILAGYNTYGDLLWESEFNASGTTNSLSSWLQSSNLVGTTSESTDIQNVVFSSDNYRVRLDSTNEAGKSWFTITMEDLTYQPLPLFFAARSPQRPFEYPLLIDGRLGCWQSSDLADWTFGYNDAAGLAPDQCINHCSTGFNTAVLVFASECYCGNYDPSNPPTDQSSFCYRPCPGDGALTCGGFTTGEGDAYYVQSQVPGAVQPEIIYKELKGLRSSLDIDITEIHSTAESPAHLTFINVFTYLPTSHTFTVHYSNVTCSSTTEFKTYGNPPQVFSATNSNVSVDIIPLKCLELRFSGFVIDFTVTLYGVPETSDHIEVPVVAVIGKNIIKETSSTVTTSTTSTTSPTTSTSSSTTSTTSTTTSTTSPTTSTSSSTTSTTSTTTSTTSPTTSTTSTTITTTSTTSSTTPTTSTTSVTTSTTSPTTNIASTTTSTAPTTPNSTTTSTTNTSIITSNSSPTSSTTSMTVTTPPSTTTTMPQSSVTTSSTANTTSLAVQTTTTAAKCYCPCGTIQTQTNLTEEELEAKIETIQKKLAVNVSELSSTVRKLTSAEDSRPTAVGIGYLGVGFLVAIFGSIIFIDSSMIFRDVKQLFHNIRDGCTGDYS